ncbi:hypothetical protein LEP1GSC193_3445 [Leptospira alstonii serovar Pingchang str. 80-412]|uniref:Uncharacterized protein n=2 Tax=Leptospira alstonii TaxID=28452 RepID=M6CIU9_9LEPT|nr:hypothetical protein LEP1GSC194_3881 [Leptospira alstonii serovar Sichuan str. 79601]EQA82014.1 hypothetical protein LEP1GSC193_3445 [Leptospira alstonii serovar Pingchang str. 80-412]
MYKNILPNEELFINKFKSTVSNLFPLIKYLEIETEALNRR